MKAQMSGAASRVRVLSEAVGLGGLRINGFSVLISLFCEQGDPSRWVYTHRFFMNQ